MLGLLNSFHMHLFLWKSAVRSSAVELNCEAEKEAEVLEELDDESEKDEIKLRKMVDPVLPG